MFPMKRALTSLLCAIFLISIWGAFPLTSYAATTYYVDSSGSDSDNGLSEDKAFKTIKYALTRVNNGDKIVLDQGSYSECGPFVIRKYGIRIEGEGPDKTEINMKSGCNTASTNPDNFSNHDGTGFLIKMSSISEPDDELGLSIENLSMNEFRYAIRTENPALSSQKLIGVDIKDVTIEGNEQENITASSCNVTESTIVSRWASSGDSLVATGSIGTGNSGLAFVARNNGYNGEIKIIYENGTQTGDPIVSTSTSSTPGQISVQLSTNATNNTATKIKTALDGNGTASGWITTTLMGDGTGQNTATNTTLTLGDGASIFLQNLTEVILSNVNFKSINHGIYIEDKSGNELIDTLLTGINMKTLKHSGIIIRGRDNGDGIKITKSKIDTLDGCGVILDSIDDSGAEVSDIQIIKPDLNGLTGTEIASMDIKNITITEPQQKGFSITGASNDELTISDITITKPKKIGFEIDAATSLSVSKVTISEGSEEGMILSDIEDFKIFGNSISKSKRDGLKILGTSTDGQIYDNMVFDNSKYGIVIDSNVESTYLYSNSVYANRADELQVQDRSDDDDGITMYFESAAAPFQKGNYYAPLVAFDSNFDGIADRGYLPDDSDEHSDKYTQLTSAKVDASMKSTLSYSTFNVPYTVINKGKNIATVKACIREKNSNTAYSCTTDNDTISPVTGVVGSSGKAYDIIVIATDINGNGEFTPQTTDTGEFTTTLSSSASGTEPAPSGGGTTNGGSSSGGTPSGSGSTGQATSAPSTPKTVSATPAANDEILITWSGNNPDQYVTKYELSRSTDNTSFSVIASINNPTTRFIDNNLTLGTTYYYTVSAVNSIGQSPSSTAVSSAPGNPSINESSSSNIVRSIATNTVVGESDDMMARLIGTPLSIDEATSNSTYSVVTQIEENDTSAVVSTRPLYNSRYSFVSPKTYKGTVTNLNTNQEISLFDDYFIIEIDYLNDFVAQTPEENLTIAVYNETTKTWTPLYSVVNSNANTVRAKTRALGYFALIAHNSPRSYTDVFSTSAFINYIGVLTRSSIVQGTGTNFNGDNFATRAELVKMKVLSEGYRVPNTVSFNPCPDVEKFEWFAPYFKVALEKGLISGFSDGMCKPFNHVTRSEATKIIIGPDGANFAGSVSFSDFDRIPNWAKPYIAFGQSRGIIGGYTDGTFKSDNQISRNEISKILVEALSKSY